MNTVDRVMVLALCNSPHCPLSVYQASSHYLKYFKRYSPDKTVTDGRVVASRENEHRTASAVHVSILYGSEWRETENDVNA